MFQNLILYLDAADLRVLSAFKSYVYLRHKSNAAEKMSPIARAKDHAATVAQADAAVALNSGHGVSSRRGAGGGGGGTGILQRRQSSPGRVAHVGGGASRQGVKDRSGAAGEEADVLSKVTIPVSLINLVVHADQRRAPLRMFHFADALPAQPPPPPPPPAHNTPSPRLMSSRAKARGAATGGGGGGGGVGPGGPGGGRDSGEVGQLLPTTREDVAASSATMPGRIELGSPGQTGGDDLGSSAPAVRHCATCETLPVVCIEDEEEEGAEGAMGGVGKGTDKREGGSEGGDRRRGGSVHEGDISANEQVILGVLAVFNLVLASPTLGSALTIVMLLSVKKYSSTAKWKSHETPTCPPARPPARPPAPTSISNHPPLLLFACLPAPLPKTSPPLTLLSCLAPRWLALLVWADFLPLSTPTEKRCTAYWRKCWRTLKTCRFPG